MRPEVAGVEHPLAVRFQEQRVGIERAVVHQIRRNPERTDLNADTVSDESRRFECLPIRYVRARRLQNAGAASPIYTGTDGARYRARP